METTNAFMTVLTESVLNWLTTNHLVMNYHGIAMGEVSGISQVSNDGTGRTGSVTHPILVTAGVFVCGLLLT